MSKDYKWVFCKDAMSLRRYTARDVKLSLSAIMIEVRKYKKGEEEVLRKICRDTTCRVNVEEYGSVLVEKWASRLSSSSKWKERVEKKKPFVAEKDGTIVGFAEFTKNGQISAFYSHYKWQGKGVGTALLDAIESEAAELGIRTIQVESSMSASKFFERRGFCVVEEKETLTDGISSRSVVLINNVADNK